MHSYTLNNWDGSQSQKDPVIATTTKLRTGLKHDNSEPKPTSGAVSNHSGERVNDLAGCSQPVGTPGWKQSGELGSHRRKTTNKGAKPSGDANPTPGGANGTPVELAAVISQAYMLPESPPRSQVLPVTAISDGRVQDQADFALSTFNSTRITVTTDLAPAQLTNPLERRLQSIVHRHPSLTTEHDTILKSPTQSGRTQSRSVDPNTVAHQIRQPGKDKLGTQNVKVKASTCRKVSSKLDSILTPRISHKDIQQNALSTQLINRKDGVAIPNTVTGMYRFDESQPQLEQFTLFTSRPSALLGAIPDTPKNHSQLLSQKPPAKSRDDSVTPTVQLTSQPLAHPLHKSTSPQLSRAKFPTPPSIEEQPSQQTIPSSVPSSPILVSDHDGYTSADAEGESADGLDLDILELQQSTTQIQTHSSPALSSSIVPATQSNISGDTITHASNHTSHTSVDDLFTPPPTGSSSQIPSKRKLSAALKRLAYVEIPPLPAWKRKKDYRPLKRRKRVSTRYSLYWEGDDQREEDSVSEYEPNKKKRTSVLGQRRQRGRPKETVRYNTRRKEVVVQPRPSPVLSETYSTIRQRNQRAKSASSTLSIRIPGQRVQQSTPGSTELIEIPDSPQRKFSPSPFPKLPQSKSPSVFSTPPPPPPQRKSSPGLATFILSPDTSISTPTPYHATNSPQLPPFFDESAIQQIQVCTNFHPPPTSIYFNTRFVQNAWNNDPAAWSSSGMYATRRCVQPTGFIWDTVSPVDAVEWEGEELKLDVGGQVVWDGCCTDEEQEVEDLLLKAWNEGRTNDKMARTLKATGSGRKLNVRLRMASADDPRNVTPPTPMTPIPKVDMMQVLKSQKAASARRTKSTKKRAGNARTRETRPSVSTSTILTPRVTTQVPSSSLPQLSFSAAGLMHLSQPPPYLSEKARGKRKAVNPEPINASPRMPPLSPPDFRDTIVLSPTNTISGSYHSANPHETFDRQMEDYIVFDLVSSPEKPRDSEAVGGSNSAKLPTIVANSVPTASSSSATQNGSPYRWQDLNNHTSDLFLPLSPSGPTPSVFGSFDGLGLGSFYDSFGVLPEGEKGEQMTTINPAFLSDNHDDYVNEIELELGGMVNGDEILGGGEHVGDDGPGPRAFDERMLGMKVGYQAVKGSPIVVSSRSSTSSSYFPSTTSGSLRTISPAAIVGGTSSPVFSDYHASSHVPKSRSFSSNITSQASSRRPSLAPASGSRARRKALIIDEDEEEEQVQRGFDLAEINSTADDDNCEDMSLPRQKRQKSSTKGPRAKSSSVGTARAVASILTITSTHRFGRRQEWECGDEESYCHQCRNKTRRLKMTCLCEKKFCNRCITARYPSLTFRLRLDGFDCPYCRNICSCDQCTRKRGEVYVSLKVSLGQVPKGDSTATLIKNSPKRLAARPPLHSRIVPLPLPESINYISGPLPFWGSIYDLDGKKIANAFSGIGEDEMVIANAVEGYTRPRTAEYVVGDLPLMRTFIGTCQPSWGLGANPIIKELGRRRKSRVNSTLDSRHTRWFIGKEQLLHSPVVVYSKNLPLPNPFSDMSSLSSLSDDSDIEAGVNVSASPKHKIYGGINANSIKELNSNFDPNAVETRDTVRALAIALEACGFVVKIDRSLVNQ